MNAWNTILIKFFYWENLINGDTMREDMLARNIN